MDEHGLGLGRYTIVIVVVAAVEVTFVVLESMLVDLNNKNGSVFSRSSSRIE